MGSNEGRLRTAGDDEPSSAAIVTSLSKVLRDLGLGRWLNAASADVTTTLRSVVVGFRVVAAVWLAVLAAFVLADDPLPPDPSYVLLAALTGLAWAGVTVAIGVKRPEWFKSWLWLAVDVGVAAWILLTSRLAGIPDAGYFGGYPMSAVFFGAFGAGFAGALAVAGALSLATVVRFAGEGLLVAQLAEKILVFAAGALAAAWAMQVVIRADQRRRRLETALATERAERARAEERAEMAAELHDSVLQTLALIERNREDPAAMVRLARRQERDLRTWLFEGPESDRHDRFAPALRRVCHEIEDLLDVRVEVVTVGDSNLDPDLEALVAAGREAVLNAAEHSGVDTIDVYSEVTNGRATVFIRDRGVGFDPDRVAPDRKGISESILGRIQRHGGVARISSSPGQGTEVQLLLDKEPDG